MEMLMQWFVDHLEDIYTAVGLALAAATLVTGWTPTPRDDEVVRKVIGTLSVVMPKDAPGTFKWPWKPL